MQLKIYHIDAFASAPFQGNPAAVCILDEWLPDVLMQAVAGELNLSETAFAVKRNEFEYRIRWFTPTTEVDLCGHATLATAHVLYNYFDVEPKAIRFKSKSGNLYAHPDEGEGIRLDFPQQAPKRVKLELEYIEAAGGHPERALKSEDLILIYSDASEIEILEPDFLAISKLPFRGLCAAAPGNGNGFDFVCRFFAPAVGINEDPVTGSAYTRLGPYFGEQFNKTKLSARQVSRRGGNVQLELRDDRIFISGKALTLMTAELFLPEF